MRLARGRFIDLYQTNMQLPEWANPIFSTWGTADLFEISSWSKYQINTLHAFLP